MSGFLFTLVAAFLAGLGARDQRLVAQLTLARRRPALLVVALGCGALASAVAVWAAQRLAPALDPALGDARPVVAHTARLLLAAFALGAAGLEALFTRARPAPEEPTASLAAAAIVLLAHQVTDAVRFITFAIAVAAPPAVPAGIGGGLGGGAALALGWLRPARFAAPRAGPRRAAGALLLVAAAALFGWTLVVAGRL